MEFGTGSGVILIYLSKKFPNSKIIGVEKNIELVKLAESAKKGKMELEVFDIITQRHKKTASEIIHDKKIQNELLESISVLLEELEKTVNGVITVKELSNKTLDKISIVILLFVLVFPGP